MDNLIGPFESLAHPPALSVGATAGAVACGPAIRRMGNSQGQRGRASPASISEAFGVRPACRRFWTCGRVRKRRPARGAPLPPGGGPGHAQAHSTGTRQTVGRPQRIADTAFLVHLPGERRTWTRSLRNRKGRGAARLWRAGAPRFAGETAALKLLALGRLWRDNPSMEATVLDKKRRMTLPQSVSQAIGLKPGDRVEWRIENGEIRGRKLVAKKAKEMFPPGSLLRYLTPERDAEQLAILSGCVQGPIDVRSLWQTRTRNA